MPPIPHRPTIHDPLAQKHVCTHCNKEFRSKSGRIRHTNTLHDGLQTQLEDDSSDNFSEVSSCPGLGSPTGSPAPLTCDIFESPSHKRHNLDSDIFNFSGENDNLNTHPLSPLGEDTASMSESTDYHPYLNGTMNTSNTCPP